MKIQRSQFDSLLLKPRGDKFIRINISRNTLIAIILSLFLHALVLLIVLPKLPLNQATSAPTTLEVSLAQPNDVPETLPTPVVPETVPIPPTENKPIIKKVIKRIKPLPKVMTKPAKDKQKPVFTVPKELAAETAKHTPPAAEPEVKTPQEKTPQVNEPTDMASYVKSQQAKRNMGESDAASQNAEAIAREQGPTEDEKRDARIKENLKVGTNGIFEITTLSGRHAAFTFKGWTNDYSNARREYFEVEASTGEDVRLLMVKKMIRLIRSHYKGDFNWESQRLNRTIVKSARVEDNAELEDFLMMEFFGARYKNT
ncbi:MAG: hypothetical protein WBP13_09495 [Methylophilaceae bacterium]